MSHLYEVEVKNDKRELWIAEFFFGKIAGAHRGFYGSLRYKGRITWPSDATAKTETDRYSGRFVAWKQEEREKETSETGRRKPDEYSTIKKQEVMKIKFIALSLCALASVNMVNAQESSKGESKHEIRLSVSDGLTQGTVDVLGMGLADAVLGSKRTDESFSMVYGLGYRYSLNRFRVGTDFGFSYGNSKLMLSGEKSPSLKEKDLNLLVLPTAEFTYYKHGLIELYGGASAGVKLNRHTETGLTDAGKKVAKKADLSTSFAYQVNPIALRVGNNRVGGFVEAGLGHKGFLTAGVSLKF